MQPLPNSRILKLLLVFAAGLLLGVAGTWYLTRPQPVAASLMEPFMNQVKLPLPTSKDAEFYAPRSGPQRAGFERLPEYQFTILQGNVDHLDAATLPRFTGQILGHRRTQPPDDRKDDVVLFLAEGKLVEMAYWSNRLYFALGGPWHFSCIPHAPASPRDPGYPGGDCDYDEAGQLIHKTYWSGPDPARPVWVPGKGLGYPMENWTRAGRSDVFLAKGRVVAEIHTAPDGRVKYLRVETKAASQVLTLGPDGEILIREDIPRTPSPP